VHHPSILLATKPTQTDNEPIVARHFLNPVLTIGMIPVLAALACRTTASTPTPHSEHPTIQIVDCDGSPVESRPWRQAPRENGLYAHLAERIPGFGGLFPEGDGLAVYLMNLDTAERARPTLEWFLRREFPELLNRAHDIHWLQGQYDWRQLAVWRDCLAGRFVPLVGAVSSDLDEGRNRISFRARDEERIAIMKTELDKTVVPREAVIFRGPGQSFRMMQRRWGLQVMFTATQAIALQISAPQR
jgi:hypothetical protein